MVITSILFLEIIACEVLVSKEIEAHNLIQKFLLILEWPPSSLDFKGFLSFNKKYIKCYFEKNLGDRILNFKPIFLRM